MSSFQLWISVLFFTLLFFLGACRHDLPEVVLPVEPSSDCTTLSFNYNFEEGCDGQLYLNPNTSPYQLPVRPGASFEMGLSNCSSSFHAAGNPDEYAYDFDLPLDEPFFAARAGTVIKVVEDQPSNGGGGAGNYLVIDHGDSTYGLYYHSPQGGIIVNPNEQVVQGQELGATGRSGFAGYPHLHFIVTQDDYNWPYQGMAISFNNVQPAEVVLQSNGNYSACN